MRDLLLATTMFAALTSGFLTSVQSAQAAQPDAKLLAAVRACDQGSRALLEKLVSIDSGSGDAEGIAAVATVEGAELSALGAQVKIVPPPSGTSPGNNVLATLAGTGKGRILLISHMDTVFNRGDVARLKPHWQGDSYYGPGAGDDKSGAVLEICALKALMSLGFTDFGRIELLLNASEEIGSPGSRDLIRARAKEADLVINLERGIPKDGVLFARKGAATLTMEFTGVAAHSGLAPEKGRNAALEAAHVALALGSLGDAAKQTTVIVDILSGGDKINVVPAHAVIKADVRAFTVAEFDRVTQGAAALAAHPGIDGVTIKSSLLLQFPPWPHTPSNDALIARARRLYAELGRSLTATAVGSSADINYAVESGTPGLDAFGMEGDGAHGDSDHADFDTLTPRAYLLARMLMDVGHDPKGK